jgi:hypothetical protein
VAIELALETGPSGKVSVEHVVNERGARRAPVRHVRWHAPIRGVLSDQGVAHRKPPGRLVIAEAMMAAAARRQMIQRNSTTPRVSPPSRSACRRRLPSALARRFGSDTMPERAVDLR